MQNIRFLLMLPVGVALAIALQGCRHDDNPAPVAEVSAVIVASVYDIDADTPSVWHSGEAFGVYMLGNGNKPLAANARHFADDRGVTGYLVPEGKPLVFPADGAGVAVTAYYPFDPKAADNGDVVTVTVTEGTAPDAYLWAMDPESGVGSPKVTLDFRSTLARIKGRVLCSDPEVAGISARLEGAPRSCGFDVAAGRYVGIPDCNSPIGVAVRKAGGAFDLSAVIVATATAASRAGESAYLVVVSLDSDGNVIKEYPPVNMEDLLDLDNGAFAPNTSYNFAGDISSEGLDIQFTGTSPICILNWATDPDEESGTIIKK